MTIEIIEFFIKILFFIDPEVLEFINNLQPVSKLDRKEGYNLEFDCKFKGRPKPKLLWLKGKLPLNNDATLKFGDNNDRY
jgi:hypothetical protein